MIKDLARQCGFDLCGIAQAKPGEEEARLEHWLANGYHGDMKYMERRKDVRDLLEGCRSVIALAVNYYHPHEYPKGPRVSRYAWGDNYHDLLGRMLDRYATALRKALPNERFRPYCDTGPLLEKAWAQRAGIGWIGKNGCLISQTHGSWIFLAIVLTTADLKPDRPHPDRCGSCDRCLHSCPTAAFVAPRVIDARKCIPYLTIEQWKPIPKKTKIAPWAFGCDACQEVCPWHSKAKTSSHSQFAPRHATPDLREWVLMKGPEYRARFGPTALARPGRRGLARNALAVLREDRIDTGILDAARADLSPLVRAQAGET